LYSIHIGTILIVAELPSLPTALKKRAPLEKGAWAVRTRALAMEGGGAEEGTPPDEAVLRVELAALKLSALKKRAKEAGVGEAELEAADDEADVKRAVIELIVSAEQGSGALGQRSGSSSRRFFSCTACCASTTVAPAVAAETQQRGDALRSELESLKPSALKKRAKEAGVGEAELEAADDEADVKGALIELLVQKEQNPPPMAIQPPAAVGVQPHFSAESSSSGAAAVGKVADRFRGAFGRKHCMFSYNWGTQEPVKAIRSRVAAAGVPTWMDVDGLVATLPAIATDHVRKRCCCCCCCCCCIPLTVRRLAACAAV
jgi:hypothetical protein